MTTALLGSWCVMPGSPYRNGLVHKSGKDVCGTGMKPASLCACCSNESTFVDENHRAAVIKTQCGSINLWCSSGKIGIWSHDAISEHPRHVVVQSTSVDADELRRVIGILERGHG